MANRNRNTTQAFTRLRLAALTAIVTVLVVAHAMLPRYEMTDAGRLDRWTGQVCRLEEPTPDPDNPFAELGAPRLVCTH